MAVREKLRDYHAEENEDKHTWSVGKCREASIILVLLTVLACQIVASVLYFRERHRYGIVPPAVTTALEKRCAKFGPRAKLNDVDAFKEGEGQRILGYCVIEHDEGGGMFRNENVDIYDVVTKTAPK